MGIEPSYFKAMMLRNQTATLFDSEKTANAAIDIFRLDNPNHKFDIEITTVFQ